MNNLRKILVGLILVLPLAGLSAVDIKSGAYTINRSDQSLDVEFSGFVFDRTYNSWSCP